MNKLLLIMALLGVGGMVGLLVWGGRGWMMNKYGRDVAWIRDTARRFNPEPINAETWTLAYYAGFGFLLLLLIWLMPSAAIGFGFWILTLFLPRFIIEWLWRKRREKIDLQLPQAIATMCNSIRAGLTLVQSVQRMTESAPEPIRTEFKIMANQYAYGADMEVVLKNAKERLNLANFNLFVTALLLNRQMGGDISETLTRISRSLDKIHEMKRTVEAHTSEGRTNIKVLLMAPVAMLLMMSLVMPKEVGMLFTTPQGLAILMIAGVLSGVGVYFAHRITRSNV